MTATGGSASQADHSPVGAAAWPEELTAEQRAEYRAWAAVIFGGHPAALPLIIEYVHGTSAERRSRSWRALQELDWRRPRPAEADEAAMAIGAALAAMLRCGDRGTRMQLATRLQAFVQAAGRAGGGTDLRRAA